MLSRFQWCFRGDLDLPRRSLDHPEGPRSPVIQGPPKESSTVANKPAEEHARQIVKMLDSNKMLRKLVFKEANFSDSSFHVFLQTVSELHPSNSSLESLDVDGQDLLRGEALELKTEDRAASILRFRKRHAFPLRSLTVAFVPSQCLLGDSLASGATSFTVGGQDVFGKALEFSAEQEAFATSIVALREHGRRTIMTIPVIPSRHHIVDVHLSRLVMDFCWAASRHTRQPLETMKPVAVIVVAVWRPW